MFNLLNAYNVKIPSSIGIEAKAIQKAKTFNIVRNDFFLSDKITDMNTIISMDVKEENNLLLFKELATRESKLKVLKMNGFFIKPRYIETVNAKRVMKNMRPVYAALSKVKKQYNIRTLTTRTGALNNMSYMYNVGYLLNEIKIKTFDNRVLMSTKIRHSILDIIKKEVLESAPKEREKIIYFKGPFLRDTKIGLNIVDSAMLKLWNVPLLFLEWFRDDEEGFKNWLTDNNVDIVFDNGDKNYLILSKSKKYQENPMFNFKYILRILHRMDGSNLKEIGLTDEEIEEIETTIANSAVDESGNPSEELTDEKIKEMELVPDDYDDVEDFFEESGDMDEIIDVEEAINSKFSDAEETEKKKTTEEMNKIFEEVPEDEKGVALLELHNYTSLKKDVETSYVADLRKKMVKNYGKDIKEVVNNLSNHKIEIAHFNNTVENDYNKSTFTLLDKSYQDKLSAIDLENTLVSPAELSYPLFLKDYSMEDISDREFKGKLLKCTYLTHQGEELSFELDVPDIVNNSMFINGSWKYLTNQDLAKPIIKTDENVIITMAYNKSILAIKGKYASAHDKMVVKTIENFSKENTAVKVKTTEELSDFIYENRMSYRMIHMNKHFGGIRYKDKGYDIDFDFRGIEVTPNGLTRCGHINEEPILHDPAKDLFYIGSDRTSYDTEDFIYHCLTLIDNELLEKSKVKRLDNLNFVNGIYATIMARELPIILIMLVETPLKDLLDRLKTENGLKYSVVKNEKLDPSKLKNTDKYGYITLEDYTIRIEYGNIINQLILVPLVNMDLTKYNIFDIAHIMKDLVGSDNTSIYLENFVTSFIDTGSKRVLEMYNIPTDFTGLFIYAASLFYDYKTYYSSDATNYRLITPTETINRIIHEITNKEFSANVARTKRGSRQTIKIPRDSVIRSLQTNMANISEDSNVSPFRSIMLKSSKSTVAPVHSNMCLKSVLKAGTP